MAALVLAQTLITVADAQRRRPRARSTSAPRIDPTRYSKFTHHTHGKDSPHANSRNLTCASCHTIPSANEPDRIGDTRNPPVARGYPYHNSCFDCHQKEIFRGDRPAICTVCHTRVSPHATAADVYAKFPKHDDLTLRQFPGYFPHKAHDRVIIKQTEPSESAGVSMLPAAFSRLTKPSVAASRVSCTQCHQKDERPPIPISVGGVEKMFMPSVGTFKRSSSGHVTCFGCHWSANEPKKDQCDGCHLIKESFATKARNLLAPTTLLSFKDWPSAWPRRVSLKFLHETPKEHLDETCANCHTGILKSETLDVPDVSLGACFKCHRSQKPSVVKEMNDEDEDIAEGRNNDPLSREGKHTCSGCHTSAIGSAPPPCSHYRVFGETYFTVEDYPKSAKQLEARCKK
ncbi:MAG: hypothetical protein ACREBG_03085 [Pyrinomonadaceae bacterium]